MTTKKRARLSMRAAASKKKSRRGYGLNFAGQFPAVYRNPNTELKTVDASGTGPIASVFAHTATVTLLNPLSLGNDIYNRVGRKISMHSLHVIGSVVGSAHTYQQDYCRAVVVYDRQANIGTATWANVMKSTDYAGNVSSGPYDFVDPSYADRFKVLADVRFSFPDINAAADPFSTQNTDFKNECNFNRYIKLKNAVAHYDSSDATPTSGALLLMTQSNTAAGSEPFTLNFNARLRFIDY